MRVIPNVAETLANPPAVIPVFTGMTGDHKRLSTENNDIRVKIHALQGFGKLCK